MSSRKRTNKAPKGCGYDYWSRRLGNNGMQGYGKSVKKHTHRLERRANWRLARLSGFISLADEATYDADLWEDEFHRWELDNWPNHEPECLTDEEFSEFLKECESCRSV